MNIICCESNREHILIFNKFQSKIIGVLSGHSGSITCLELTQDENKIISSSNDGTIKIWDYNTQKILIDKPNAHNSRNVIKILLSNDGTKLISGGGDFSIKIWDFNTMKIISTLSGHTNSVNLLAIVPLSNKLISGSSYEKKFGIWDMDKPEEKAIFVETKVPISSILVTNDSKYIISALKDGTINKYDIESQKLIWNITDKLHTPIFSIAQDPKSNYFYSYDANWQIKTWDINSSQNISDKQFLSKTINYQIKFLEVSSNLKKIFSYDENHIIIWDYDKKKNLYVINNIGYIHRTKDLKKLFLNVYHDHESHIEVFDTDSFTYEKDERIIEFQFFQIMLNEKMFITNKHPGIINIWDFIEKEPKYTLKHEIRLISEIKFCIECPNTSIIIFYFRNEKNLS